MKKIFPLVGLFNIHVYNFAPPHSWSEYCTALSFVWGQRFRLSLTILSVKVLVNSHSKQISKTTMLGGRGGPKSKLKAFTIKTPL